jgi:hypothetical protein
MTPTRWWMWRGATCWLPEAWTNVRACTCTCVRPALPDNATTTSQYQMVWERQRQAEEAKEGVYHQACRRAENLWLGAIDLSELHAEVPILANTVEGHCQSSSPLNFEK